MYLIHRLEFEPPEHRIDSLEKYSQLIKVLGTVTMHLIEQDPDNFHLVVYTLEDGDD